MADILPFNKKKPAEKHKGHILCLRGFHQWKVDKEQEFDTRQGKLVTVYKCQRCGKTKNQAI